MQNRKSLRNLKLTQKYCLKSWTLSKRNLNYSLKYKVLSILLRPYLLNSIVNSRNLKLLHLVKWIQIKICCLNMKLQEEDQMIYQNHYKFKIKEHKMFQIRVIIKFLIKMRIWKTSINKLIKSHRYRNTLFKNKLIRI